MRHDVLHVIRKLGKASHFNIMHRTATPARKTVTMQFDHIHIVPTLGYAFLDNQCTFIGQGRNQAVALSITDCNSAIVNGLARNWNLTD